MARRKNKLEIDFRNFSEYAEKLEALEADLQKVFGEAMEEAGLQIAADTIAALGNANLPAGGKYSKGKTKESVIMTPKVTWSGAVGEMPIGFDKTKPGAGGWLITGTPKMKPDYALQKIYSTKGYEKQIRKKIEESLQRAIDERIK